MAALIAIHRRTVPNEHHKRYNKACFRWRRNRHLLPWTVSTILLFLLWSLFLGLAWWYTP